MEAYSETNQEKLMTGSLDVLTSLSRIAIKSLAPAPGLDRDILDRLSYIRTMLGDISPDLVSYIDVRTRSVRPGDKLSPFSHTGISIRYETPVARIFINFWGGIRAFSNSDLHDSTVNHQKGVSHTSRTESTSEEDTHLNIQIADNDSKLLDLWLKRLNTKQVITVSKLIDKRGTIDFASRLNISQSEVLKKLNQDLSSSINALTRIIPSAV